MIGIPKRLVPSSPVRNLIRRVVRESYRACARRDAARLQQLSVLVNLLRLPLDAAQPAQGPGGAPVRAFARRPTDRALKRALRAEADTLFARILGCSPDSPRA